MLANGIVKKEEVVETVKRVMYDEGGEEMRKNVKELKNKTADKVLDAVSYKVQELRILYKQRYMCSRNMNLLF